jgi:hypothetical protein
MNLPAYGLLALLCAPAAVAQPAAEGERPPRPAIASNAAVGGWCDALTGAKKDECLRDERRRDERRGHAEGRSSAGACDGPGIEREHCLRQGGDPRRDGGDPARASTPIRGAQPAD